MPLYPSKCKCLNAFLVAIQFDINKLSAFEDIHKQVVSVCTFFFKRIIIFDSVFNENINKSPRNIVKILSFSWFKSHKLADLPYVFSHPSFDNRHLCDLHISAQIHLSLIQIHFTILDNQMVSLFYVMHVVFLYKNVFLSVCHVIYFYDSFCFFLFYDLIAFHCKHAF